MIIKQADPDADDRGAMFGIVPAGAGEGWGYVPAGTLGQVLTVQDASGDLGWSTPTAGMAVGNPVSGGSNNAVLIESGTGNLAALAIGSTGQVLTVASGAPTWAAPVTDNYVQATLASTYTITESFANIGCSLVLPGPGVYLLFLSCVNNASGQGSVGQYSYVVQQLIDTTNTIYVANSLQTISYLQLPVASVTCTQIMAVSCGPYVYSVASGTPTINVQAFYNTNMTGYGYNTYYIASYYNTVLTALRIA